MKKKLLSTMLSAVMLCTGFTCAYAADFSFEEATINGMSVTIEGTAGDRDKYVSAIVLYPDENGNVYETEDINLSSMLSENIPRVKTLAESEIVRGRFIIRIFMNENDANGVYTVYSADENGEMTRKTTFEYYSDNLEDVIAEIQSAVNSEGLAELLESMKDDVGFKNTLVGLGVKIDSYYALESTYRNAAAAKIEDEETITAENIKTIFNSAIAVEELNAAQESSIINILGLNNTYFGLDMGVDSDYASMSTVEKEDFTELFAKKDFSVLADVKSYFAEAIALAKLNCAETTSGVEALIEKYNSIYNFDLNGAYATLNNTKKGQLLISLTGSDFTSAQLAKAAFDSKLSSLTTNNPGSTGGGVGGGGAVGGGGNRGGSSVTISNIAEIQSIPAFKDIENHWAREQIEKLSQKGIVNGTDGYFRPDDRITREEFVKILCCTLNITPDGESKFADVPSKAWYAPYIAAMTNADIVAGISEDSFGVGENITRQDMAVLVSRAMDYMGTPKSEVTEKTFADDSKISDYAKTAVYELNASGVIKGIDGEHFAPRELATRAQASVMICAAIDIAQN